MRKSFYTLGGIVISEMGRKVGPFYLYKPKSKRDENQVHGITRTRRLSPRNLYSEKVTGMGWMFNLKQ